LSEQEDCILEGDPYELGFEGYTESEALKMLDDSRGLGDLAEWVLNRVGVRPKPGCGCTKRKEWLNKIKIPKII